MGFSFQLYDNVPVIALPDGRRALIDTGCCFFEAISGGAHEPFDLGDRRLHPVNPGIDLSTIGRRISAPRLDLLIGVPVLREGFSIDLDQRLFELGSAGLRAGEEEVASLRWTAPQTAGPLPPIVEVEIAGSVREAAFDTGASFSLWGARPAAPDPAASPTRHDLHVGLDGALVDFPVYSRTETLRLGDITLDLDVSYLPDTWSPILPQCILGMDVPAALGASRFALDPGSCSIRFFRR